MISTDLESELTAILGSPMTTEHIADLERRLRSRPVRRVGLPSGPIRGVTLLAATLALATLLVAGVTATILTTESPGSLVSAEVFQAELDAAKAEVPKPDGASWPPSLDASAGAMYSKGGGQASVEAVAFCLWTRSWLVASATGDVAQTEIAAETLADVPTWPGYRGVFSDQSYRDELDKVIAGVAIGDPKPAERFADINCAP